IRMGWGMTRSETTPSGLPTVAVVICTADRIESLRRTLGTIWTQERPPDEVIVVDDGCLDAADIAAFETECNQLRIRWVYHRKSIPGLTRSRNVAARLAKAHVLLYLDDDVSCDRRLVAEVAAAMQSGGVAGVAPTVLEPTWCNAGSRVFQLA